MTETRSGTGEHGQKARKRTKRPKLTGKGWQSRQAAARILMQIEHGAALDTALDSVSEYTDLQGSDKGWARSMVSAALRGCGRLDAALAQISQRALHDCDPAVRALLRIGAAQIWLLGVPPHAAVATCVDAARAMSDARSAGGFINAVLRRASTEPALFTNIEAIRVWPDWLAQTMIDSLGEARAQALARYQLQPPSLDLQIRTPSNEDWVQRLDGHAIPGGVRLNFGTPISKLPGYADGAWWIQDAAAALAVRLLKPVAGQKTIDLCAAPGGKTLQLAAAGAHVTALDHDADRLTRLYDNLKRTGLGASCRVVCADARKYETPTRFDSGLLDAPCSSLGTLRRHPEAIWQRHPEKLSDWLPMQHALLQASARLLKPGGTLVYCVCTPAKCEGSDIIEQALASGLWRRDPIDATELGDFAYALTPQGDVLTAPPADGSDESTKPLLGDVFFMARLIRV